MPTPVVDAGGNAGLLREAKIPRKYKKLNPAQDWFDRLPKAEKAVFYKELNSALSTLTDDDWTHFTIVVVNTYEHGFVCDVFGDDNFTILQMWNLEKKHGKLSAVQVEVRNAISRGGEEFNKWNGKFWSRRTDDSRNHNGFADGKAENVFGKVDKFVRRKEWVLSSARTLPDSIEGGFGGDSDGSGVGKNAGSLRGASPLDEHLQACCVRGCR